MSNNKYPAREPYDRIRGALAHSPTQITPYRSHGPARYIATLSAVCFVPSSKASSAPFASRRPASRLRGDPSIFVLLYVPPDHESFGFFQYPPPIPLTRLLCFKDPEYSLNSKLLWEYSVEPSVDRKMRLSLAVVTKLFDDSPAPEFSPLAICAKCTRLNIQH